MEAAGAVKKHGRCDAFSATPCDASGMHSVHPLQLTSWYHAPDLALSCCAISIPLCTKSATESKSDSMKPRDVNAGEPMRMPPGTIALLSPGTVFLFSAMCASSSTRSTLHNGMLLLPGIQPQHEWASQVSMMQSQKCHSSFLV